ESARQVLGDLPASAVESVFLDARAKGLRDAYLAAKVVGPKRALDATHVAIATIARADALLSWDRRHIVGLARVQGYNRVNRSCGYQEVTIATPTRYRAAQHERPEQAPIDALGLKRKVQAKLLKATKGMTPEEERAFYTELARTGPLGAWWTEVEAQSRARAGVELSDDTPGVVPASLGGEKSSVQKPFIRYAIDAGWTYLAPEEAMNLRRGVTSPVLDAVLVDQLQRLNPGVVDHLRAEDILKRLIRVKPNIEGNLDAWEYLKGLKTVFVAAEKRERNIRLLDPAHVEANTFHVTDEFTFSNGTPPDIRTDIMLFVNGVPVIVAETKAATHMDGLGEALEDLRYYHKKGPELLAVMQIHALTHLVQFYYGATWNLSRKGLFNWRDELAQGGDFETLAKTFIAPRRVLRVITEFILFTRKDEELSKAILRPHQMRAVERTVQRAKDASKRRGLIWHTQGSGKTYTMITVAKRLIEDPAFENPTVLMIVDRNELEAQLFGNLEAVGFGKVAVAESKKDLQKLLKADRRGLIVSMIHKFEGIPEKINQRSNVFVLIDEAHRTTGGDLGNYLMGALPNATYIGFTGTPIDRTAYGKGTFKTFGTDDPKGYLDKYSIKESVLDGTTVPLHYSLAPNDLRVDRETLEKEFLELAELEGVSDVA